MKFRFKTLLFVFCTQSINLIAQTVDSIHYSLEGQAIGTKQDVVPFWMRTNQYGSIPTSGLSSSFIGNLYKPYSRSKANGYFDPNYKKFDLAYALEGRVNVGDKSDLKLIEAYVKVKYGAFQLMGGRSREIMGLVDSTLSAGAFAISGNALGIPKIDLSIPEYTKIPFISDFIGIKGNFVMGWFGRTDLIPASTIIVDSVKSYYHQKSFYVRLGRPESTVKLFGGFNHQVMWGNEREIYGADKFKLGDFESFFYVLAGKAYGGGNYGARGVPRSKIGNQIGSIDQGIELDFSRIKVSAYHQFFYDVGGLYHLNNIKDGIWGLVLKKGEDAEPWLGWEKILIEIVNSKSQGGELNAKITPSGDENYYNNYFTYGWSYGKENLGNNLLTNRKYAREGLPALPEDYVINNRVTALHFGLEGGINGWTYKTKLTYSKNYGTYGASREGKSRNRIRIIGPPPYFEETSQFSGFFYLGKTLPKGYTLGLSIAGDKGGVLYESFGSLISLKKQW